MNLKNIKIGTQLKLGFAITLFFVVVLGAVSYYQSDQIHLQTETMYNHPLKVRRAIGQLNADIITIRMNMKDLFLFDDENKRLLSLNDIELRKSSAFDQFDLLYSSYLGPRSDIDYAKQSFIKWNTTREETIRILNTGKKQEAAARTTDDGVDGKGSIATIAAINKIDDFAKAKGDELYANSIKVSNSLNMQLIILVAIILLLIIIINYILLRSIRKPLTELADATKKFHEGNFEVRSNYNSKNEFGELSVSFNNLTESIQTKINLDEKIVSISALMMSKYEAAEFFQETINQLALYTGSQMAAVYLLSDDKKTFNYFQSTGMDNNAKKSFAADSFEGEFGLAISSRKIQHIKNISEDTRFVFHTVSGKFIPHEIITIPIISDEEIIAFISLASIHTYNKQSVQLIESIYSTLTARVNGIVAYHKMRVFSDKLEQQNNELEAQKTELSSQSAELMEQNTELEMQKKQLNEASRLKTNFLSNMSHELRTPLNSVIALSGVLNRRLAKQIPDEEYSYLEVIERNGKNLLALINDILDISRIESGKEEVEITKFNIHNQIAEVVSMINPQAKQKKIELIQLNNESEILVTNDAHKMRHILQNIIGNAVKFTEIGKVEIKAENKDKNIVITVTDTGIGIAEENLKHIFDEFRQADGSTSRRFGGTGLGLAIAKKYANLLGGTITVKSDLNKGSEFTVVLPINYSADNIIIDEEFIDVKYEIKQSSHKSSDSLTKTILLVEDSEPAIIQMKDILEENGYKIIVACDGKEALNIISNTIPDAMILDLMMPGVDGFEVLKTIRNADATAKIPVLILTAKHLTKEDLKLLKRNNVHQLIQKGDINLKDLLNAVYTMVNFDKVETIKPKREIQNIKGFPKILVIEDNADNLITVKALLANNYIVIEATDGKEGIEMAKKHIPDLVLMDIALPGIDGIETFKIIRDDLKLQNIPIIAITASAMIHDRESILAHGFDSYIPKPIDEKLFFKTIKEVLYGE